jgi:hypothetical protein
MKKFTLTMLGVALVLTAVYAASTQTKNTGAGMQIATTSSQKLGFWGATPTNQLTIAIGGISDAERLTNLIAALRVVGLVSTN